MARIFGDRELANLKAVFRSKELGWHQGGMVTRLDEAFAAFTGARYGVCRNSAMTALAQAVSISGAGCGDEVICDPLVHFGGVAALSFNCVPKFVDVKYDTYLMDPSALEKAITRHTKALIVTNLWGLCAELDRIREICRKHNIFMIEDCAHAIGAKWKGKHAGTYGDIGVFSFQQGKHICTGDGGIIVTDDAELHDKLYSEWAFKGESPSFLTLNFRMNELTAAVGLAQLERFPGYLREYNDNLARYNEAIADGVWLRGRTVPEEAEQVVRDENLAVTMGAGADANGRRWNGPGNFLAEGRWHTFEDHGKYAGFGQRLGIVQERLGFGRFFPLDFIAAHGMNALRREPDVA